MTHPDSAPVITDEENEELDTIIAVLGANAPSYDDFPDDEGDSDAAFLKHSKAGGPHHGLSPEERIRVRRLIKFAAVETFKRKDQMHYTQGPRRWDGINLEKRCYPGNIEYPNYADCSAGVTWLYWNALKRHINNENFPDILNDANWKAGYTGTLLSNGRGLDAGGVPSLVGDLVLYGSGRSAHVAIYVGNGMVWSFGSEAGPFILPWRYRSDVRSVRRYI